MANFNVRIDPDEAHELGIVGMMIRVQNHILETISVAEQDEAELLTGPEKRYLVVSEEDLSAFEVEKGFVSDENTNMSFRPVEDELDRKTLVILKDEHKNPILTDKGEQIFVDLLAMKARANAQKGIALARSEAIKARHEFVKGLAVRHNNFLKNIRVALSIAQTNQRLYELADDCSIEDTSMRWASGRRFCNSFEELQGEFEYAENRIKATQTHIVIVDTTKYPVGMLKYGRNGVAKALAFTWSNMMDLREQGYHVAQGSLNRVGSGA